MTSKEKRVDVEGEAADLLRDLVKAIDTYGEMRWQYWPETIAAANYLTRRDRLESAAAQTQKAEG